MSVDVDEALNQLLTTNADVCALVDDRVFPNRIPQLEELPAIVLTRRSGGRIPTLGGDEGMKRAVFAVEALSLESQEKAREIDLAVQAAFAAWNEGTQRELAGWRAHPILILPDTDQDDPELPAHADDLGAFGSMFEIRVFYEQV